MKKTAKIIAFMLFAVILLSVSVLSALALKSDYSKPGATSITSLGAPEVLKGIFGIELSEAEENYLTLYGDYELIYGSNIPASYATVAYDESLGMLAVTAKQYSYTATNGVKVIWRPSSARIADGEAVPLVENSLGYTAMLGFDGRDEDAAVSITYTTELSVSATILNGLLNKSYTDGESWKKFLENAEAEYKQALEKFESDSKNYTDYLKALEDYKSALALYNAYLKDKRIYDEKLGEYNDYLKALDDYEAALKIFNDYEAALIKYNSDYALYQQYLTDKANYDKNLAAYKQYVEKHKIALSHIAIIDGMKSYSTSLNRSVYDAIMGDTVTKVIDNKDAIANSATGVDGAIVDAAGTATENIRLLYKEYFALKDEAQKYSYYALSYESWRDNFTSLMRALDKLYTYPKVRFALGEQGIQTKYEILLAQLFYVVNALSDEPVKNYDGKAYFDSSYVINPLTEIKPLARLEYSVYMVDTGAAKPLKDGYPTPVKEPVLTEVFEPTKPTYVTKPTAPTLVENPGDAPTEVAEPTAPTEVKEPGNEPKPYAPSDEIKELIAAFDRGEIVQREKCTEAKKLSVSVTLNKRVFNPGACTVVFKNTYGEILSTVEVEKGTYAEYSGELPTKPDDSAATYKFVGWQDIEGNIQSLDAVESSMELYPAFVPTYKTYKVTWVVGDNAVTEDVTYGEIPEYEGTPSIPEKENRIYAFTGWNKEITPVSGNAIYIAQFSVSYVVTMSNGDTPGFSYEDNGDLTIDMGKSYDTSVNLSLLLPRHAEKGALTVKSQLYTLEFSYSDVIAMEAAGVSEVRVNNVKSSGGIRLSVDFVSKGRSLSVPLRAGISVKCDVDDVGAFSVYTLEGATRVPVNYKLNDGYLTLSCVDGNTYYTATEYSVNLLFTEPIAVKLSGNSFSVGDTVEIFAVAPAGVSLDGVYVIDAAGNKTYLTDDSFVMTKGGISVGVDYHYYTYTVTFVSDGKIVSTAEYTYGEYPEKPPAPPKASDGKYTYEFLGWNREIVAVNGDATYTAVYKSTPIPIVEKPDDGLQISDGVLEIIVAAAVALGYLLLVFLPVSIISATKLIMRKRRKLPKKEKSNTGNGLSVEK